MDTSVQKVTVWCKGEGGVQDSGPSTQEESAFPGGTPIKLNPVEQQSLDRIMHVFPTTSVKTRTPQLSPWNPFVTHYTLLDMELIEGVGMTPPMVPLLHDTPRPIPYTKGLSSADSNFTLC